MAGGRIDPSAASRPLNIAVMTISDSRDSSTDSSGDLLAERIAAAAMRSRPAASSASTRPPFKPRRALDRRCRHRHHREQRRHGPEAREVAPEAFRELFDRELEGFIVLWHLVSYETVGVSTMQSRACAGIAAIP
jgi:molybdenum cofactor biosynthesis protein B